MDCRDRAALFESHWKGNFNEKTMMLKYTLYDEEEGEQEVEVPAMYVTCNVCHGKGKYVNPSIDCGGISSEDFYEDSDFADDYFSGVYDIVCRECDGLRVIPTINVKLLKCIDKVLLKKIRDSEQDDADFESLCMSERMRGA